MTPIKYYVSSQLFIEVLECVNYLHKQNPPIIHCSLKALNVLITFNTYGRVIKLADFHFKIYSNL